MDRQWQDQLLSLVTRYGEACAQVAAERERGQREHPPADRAGAWAAILTHVAAARAVTDPDGARAATPR